MTQWVDGCFRYSENRPSLCVPVRVRECDALVLAGELRGSVII